MREGTIPMDYVLTGLVAVCLLLFIFRRQIKRGSRRWMVSDSARDNEKRAKTIAREKKLMEDETQSVNREVSEDEGAA